MIKTIAVDDEPRAIEVIKGFSEKIPFMSLENTFRDPIDAIEYLQGNACDLILLDINMPNLSGLELIETLEKRPMVIFTTAHSNFAVESYDLGVIDYLLKPIKFNRFLKALTRANNFYKGKEENSDNTFEANIASGSTIFIKSGPKTYKVNTDDILYLEKDGNYLIFHTPNKKILSRQSIGDVFEILNKNEFIRVHKSFIVPLKKISVIERNQIKIGKVEIPIGRTYKDDFFKNFDID